MGAKRYETLDGMRGLCALMVAITHCDRALRTGHLLNHAWLSVDVFFVLSGFVIAHTYEQRLTAGNALGSFVRARVRRLIPAHVVGTLIVAASWLALYRSGVLQGSSPGAILLGTLFGLLLLPIEISSVANFAPAAWQTSFPINPPLWSLRGEWIVNLIYGWVLFRAKARMLGFIFLVLAAYSLFEVFHVRPAGEDFTTLDLLWLDSARAGTGFIAGVLIFRANAAGAFQHIPRMTPALLFSIWFLLCAVPTTHFMPAYEMTVTLLVAPAIVALLVCSERPMPQWVRWLGRLSYPLYVSHFAIVNLARIYWRDQGRHNPLWTIPMLLAALVLAAGVDLLINSRWIRQIYGAGLFWRPARQTASQD